jgi:glycosyltransferase involved in cell wall biosynthesis
MKLLITTQIVDKNDPILGFFHEWIIEFSMYFDRIDIICLKKGYYDLPAHVYVHSLGKEKGESNIKYLFNFYRFFSTVFFNVRVDYVFFHMGAIFNILAFPFFAIRSFFGTKFYWWKTHGHINLIGKLALCGVDAVFTASTESFPIETKKRRIVGHAIPVDDVVKIVETWPPKVLECVCIGRITRSKRIEKAIETLKILKDHKKACVLRIIGDFVDEEYKQELDRMIESSHLGSSVIFCGPMSPHQMRTYVQSAHILIHPSETGSIDKVVLESIQNSIVPIAQCGAYGSLLGSVGLCVTKNVPMAYATIIERIHTLSREEINALLSQLRIEVVQNHNLTTLPNRIFGV